MNQNPEQQARDRLDDQLTACGCLLQDKKSLNLAVGIGAALREFHTSVGPADYVLFGNRKSVGLIEAKREEKLYKKSFYQDKLIRCGSIIKEPYHSAFIDYAANSGQAKRFLLSRTKRPLAKLEYQELTSSKYSFQLHHQKNRNK